MLFEVPKSPAANSERCNLDELVIHEDEIRPMFIMQRHNDWINNVN